MDNTYKCQEYKFKSIDLMLVSLYADEELSLVLLDKVFQRSMAILLAFNDLIFNIQIVVTSLFVYRIHVINKKKIRCKGSQHNTLNYLRVRYRSLYVMLSIKFSK